MNEKIKWRIYPFMAYCHYCYSKGIEKKVFILDKRYGNCRECIKKGYRQIPFALKKG